MSKRKRAVHAVVSAVYFADSSDYLNYLWDVIKELDPKMCEVLAGNPERAYKKSCKRIGAECE